MGKPTTNSTKKTTARKSLPKNGTTHPSIAQAAAPASAPAAVSIPAPEARARRTVKATKAVEPKPEKKKTAPRRTTTAQNRALKLQLPTTNVSYSQEDVALRAYFIGEKRQQTGAPGSPESDWLEAERQLRVEYGA